MESAIIIVDRGMDVQPYTGITYKETNHAPYFDLRRTGVADTTVLVAPIRF